MTDIYGDLSGFKDYHDERGNDHSAFTDQQLSAALLRASEYIDGRYGPKFPGEPAIRRENGGQDREWPRVSSGQFGYLRDRYDNPIPENTVPLEVIKATYEIALREAGSPGVMSPDVNRSQRKRSVRVEGAVSVEYADASDIEAYRTVVTIVDAILAPILTGAGASSGLMAQGIRVY